MEQQFIDIHLCQDCVDKLGVQEFVDSAWDVEEQARYDYNLVTLGSRTQAPTYGKLRLNSMRSLLARGLGHGAFGFT